jgi:hypothetical protein
MKVMSIHSPFCRPDHLRIFQLPEKEEGNIERHRKGESDIETEEEDCSGLPVM